SHAGTRRWAEAWTARFEARLAHSFLAPLWPELECLDDETAAAAARTTWHEALAREVADLLEQAIVSQPVPGARSAQAGAGARAALVGLLGRLPEAPLHRLPADATAREP